VVKRLRAKGGDYWYTFDCVLPSAPTYVMGSGPAFPTRAACEAAVARLQSARFNPAHRETKTMSDRPLATNKKQLIDLIADRTGIPPVDVGVVFQELIKSIAHALANDHKVTLSELGSFSRVDGKPTFKPSSAFTKLAE